jgi:hypothetical protein
MWYFTELADWWDKQREQSEHMLDRFVQRNPNQFGIVVSTAAHTSFTLGSGFVDLLRLGDGVSQGGLRGLTQDGLRLVGVASPVGKGIQLLKSSANTTIASLIVDIGGPRCSWVASTKAMVQTGNKVNGKLFSSVDDLAKAVGVPVAQTAGISLQAMANNLAKIGAKVSPLKEISNLKEVVQMLPKNGSVVMVSVKGVKDGVTVGGHAVYIFYNKFGKVKIMDRTGEYGTLNELAIVYKAQVDEFIPRAAVTLTNVYAKYMVSQNSAVLAIEVLAVASEKNI